MDDTTDDIVEQQKPSMINQIKWKFQDIKWMIIIAIESMAISVLRWTQRDSNIVKHANREFDIMYANLQNDQLDELMRKCVIDLIAVLSSQNHSGGSIGHCLYLFKQLASFKCITPLTGEDNEWRKDTFDFHQNIRMSDVFKDLETNKAYVSDHYVFEEDTGACYTNKHSRKYITFPYSYEEKVYIKVDKDGIPLTKRDRKLTGFKETEEIT